jgi:hypothetical protein
MTKAQVRLQQTSQKEFAGCTDNKAYGVALPPLLQPHQSNMRKQAPLNAQQPAAGSSRAAKKNTPQICHRSSTHVSF